MSLTKTCTECGRTFAPGKGYDTTDPRPEWYCSMECLRARQKGEKK